MVIQRTFEVCSEGIAETRRTRISTLQIGSAVFAHVTESKDTSLNAMYFLEEGGRVIDPSTGEIVSSGDGSNTFELPRL